MIPVNLDLSVVIVTYNSQEVIRPCLEALSNSGESNLEIIVVDNASSDETVATISREFPNVHVLRNDHNVGFACAVNRGVRNTSKSHIALLNPDAVVTIEALARLIGIQKEHGRPSIVAPRILHPDGRLRIVSAGRFPTPWRMFCHYFGFSRLFSSELFEGHYFFESRLAPLQSVDWATGAMLIVRRVDWKMLNGLSERWFMYAEDIDFCWRAKSNGMDVLLARDTTATHLVGGSSSKVKSLNADWVVNLYDFYATSMHASGIGKICWKIVVSVGLLSRSLVYLVQSKLSADHDAKKFWLRESSRFSAFARQLLRASI